MIAMTRRRMSEPLTSPRLDALRSRHPRGGDAGNEFYGWCPSNRAYQRGERTCHRRASLHVLVFPRHDGLDAKQLTNVERPEGIHAPMNAFANVAAYPTAEMKVVVRPNFDTLYSSAWLDLTKEPMIISAPNTDGRYYMLPMLDMWTDVLLRPAGARLVLRSKTGRSSRQAGPAKLPQGVGSDQRPDTLCLDYRPHQD